MRSMWKKLIAAVLAVALALAGAAAGAETLENHVWSSRLGIFEKWRSRNSTRDHYTYEMMPGEYLVTEPFYWIDTNFLSYTLTSISSSDEEVVAASFYHPGGSSDLSVQFHAKAPGTATVTAELSMFLTKEGDEYHWAGAGGAPRLTKTFDITVGNEPIDNPLRIDMQVVSDVDGTPVTEAVLGLNTMLEQMAKELGMTPAALQSNLVNSAFAQDHPAMAAFKKLFDYARGRANDWTYVLDGESGEARQRTRSDILSDLAELFKSQTKDQIQSAVLEGLSELGTLAGYARMAPFFSILGSSVFSIVNFHQAAYELAKIDTLQMPTSQPARTYVEVTMENISDFPVAVDMELSFSEDLSLSSHVGPRGNSLRVCRTVAPHSEAKVRLPFYVGYHKLGRPGQSGPVYEGTIDASGSYSVEETEQSWSISERASLPVYTDVTLDRMQMYANQVDNADNEKYYKRYFPELNPFRMYAVACPVELVVLDGAGNELAAVGSGDENVYLGDGIAAWAEGEQKFVSISPEHAGEYRLQIRALEDGEMQVFACDRGEDAAMGARVYTEVPLAAGQIFDLDPSEGNGGSLVLEDGEGAPVEVQPALTIDAESVRAALAGAGASDWAVEPLAGALQRGLVPGPGAESFQAPLGADEFCEMLVNLYELCLGVEPGESAQRYAGLHPDAEIDPATGAAIELGLLDEALLDTASGEAVSRGTAAQMMLNCLELAGLDALAAGGGYYLPEAAGSGGEAAEAAEAEPKGRTGAEAVTGALALGIFGAEAGAPAPEDALTREQGIAAIFELWTYMRATIARDEFVVRSYGSASQGMESFYPSMFGNYGIYGNSFRVSSEDSGSAMRSFSLRLGAVDATEYCGDDLQTLLSAAVGGNAKSFVQQYIGERGHTEIPAPLDPERADADRLCFFPEGEGFCWDGDTFYHWMPVCFTDDEGGIFEDTVYLCVFCAAEGVDEDAAPILTHGDDHVDMMVIADQRVAAEYLRMIRPAIERGGSAAPVYAELSKGSKGDDVAKLQQRLKDLGYLDGAVDGDFGNKSAAAVSAFQEAMGLEATGVADSQTQALLFPQPDNSELLTDWMDRHSGD